MDATWLPIGAAAVGALAVLAGNTINPLVNARRAHEGWLRDKRTELCEEFYVILQAAEGFVNASSSSEVEGQTLRETCS